MAVSEQSSANAGAEIWPELSTEGWRETQATLHLWMQVVGKVRLALAPRINHWWHVPFYVTARGLTTSPISHQALTFQIDFDFLRHQLLIETSTGMGRSIALKPRSVADFYQETMTALRSLGIEVSIWTTPVEIANPIPFEQDEQHAAYDRETAHRFWRVLVESHRVLTAFRARFRGKVSPVHFFWGSFDLAVTRFSGRIAPPHPGAPNIADSVTREAYSHEVSSCGFWPGSAGVSEAVFYAYAYPEPEGFKNFGVRPAAAAYSPDFGEFLLPYEAVRRSDSPDEDLFAFLQSTYEAAAVLARWDRAALEP